MLFRAAKEHYSVLKSRRSLTAGQLFRKQLIEVRFLSAAPSFAAVALTAEHFLGKEEDVGSSPTGSSIIAV